MDRKKVLFLFGGESSEHEVSIASAANIYAGINPATYEVLPVYITKEGRWWLLPEFSKDPTLSEALELLPALGQSSFVLPTGEHITPDVIVPALHGKNGEDGSVQGLAQLLHIPIVGCDAVASAICMDKVATKQIMQANNVPIVAYKTHLLGEQLPSSDEVVKELGLPLFVKPSRAGSSVGVSKVHTEEEFVAAINEAHRHDKVALIESGLSIREIEVAVLGTPPFHKATIPGEINTGDEFYSYDDKYAEASTSSVSIPADLSETQAVEIQSLAKKVYQLLGCSGLARVDFFLASDGTVYLNEVNTLPGFTNISMYPKLWQHQGIDGTMLIDLLIEDALGARVQ